MLNPFSDDISTPNTKTNIIAKLILLLTRKVVKWLIPDMQKQLKAKAIQKVDFLLLKKTQDRRVAK